MLRWSASWFALLTACASTAAQPRQEPVPRWPASATAVAAAPPVVETMVEHRSTEYDFGDDMREFQPRQPAWSYQGKGRRHNRLLRRAREALSAGVAAMSAFVGDADPTAPGTAPVVAYVGSWLRLWRGDVETARLGFHAALQRWHYPDGRAQVLADFMYASAFAGVAPPQVRAEITALKLDWKPRDYVDHLLETGRRQQALALLATIPGATPLDRARNHYRHYQLGLLSGLEIAELLAAWDLLQTLTSNDAAALRADIRADATQVAVLAHKIYKQASDLRYADTALLLYNRLLAGKSAGQVLADDTLSKLETFADDLARTRLERTRPRAIAGALWRPGLIYQAAPLPFFDVDKAMIQRGLRWRFPELKHCHARAATGNNNLEGRVTLTFSIDENGGVTPIGATADGEPALQELAQCALEVAASIRLPNPPHGGRATVRYPIYFKTVR